MTGRLIRPANSCSHAASPESQWDSNWTLKSCLTLGTSGYVSAVPNQVFWELPDMFSAPIENQRLATSVCGGSLERPCSCRFSA
jgi:hypothetical protein